MQFCPVSPWPLFVLSWALLPVAANHSICTGTGMKHHKHEKIWNLKALFQRSPCYRMISTNLLFWAAIAMAVLTVFYVSLGVFFIVNRDHQIVKDSHLSFILTVILGSILINFAVLQQGLEASFVSFDWLQVSCVSQPWVLSFSFVLIMGSLLAKMWYVLRPECGCPCNSNSAVWDYSAIGLS